jgi:phosphate transport system protein
MVEDAINKATTAFLDRRPELADQVMHGDDLIDRKEVEIEEECLKVLALHQPVATDLRFIVAVLKVNNDLERMGDHAANVAERAAYLSTHDPIEVPRGFIGMVERVRAMVRECLDALVNLDTELARKVRKQDADVDAACTDMYEVMQSMMHRNPETIERAVQTLGVAKHMERVADLATNVAEDVIFLVEGEVVRHRH